MSKYGRSLKVFVMGPEHKGLKLIEVVNWTGIAHVGGREHLAILKNRPELSETGIYFLLSTNEEDGDGLTKIYIGETDNFANRLSHHARTKDWWDSFVVFSTRDQNLTKAHVRYLEKVFYDLAVEAKGTLELGNTAEPTGAKLPEPDISAMKEFSDNIIFVLETMGLTVFPSQQSDGYVGKIKVDPQAFNDLSGTKFVTYLRGDENLSATLIAKDGKYVLEGGSHITANPVDSFKKRHGPYFKLWKSIAESNIVKPAEDENYLTTLEPITFKSPSAAGAVVYGRATNGRTKWKRHSDGKPLGDCQVEDLEDEVA